MKITLTTFLLVSLTVFGLSGCGPKTSTPLVTPTAAPKSYDLAVAQQPYLSLIPRNDGREIVLKLKNVPSDIRKIEYEFIYTAVDGSNQIEKGASGNLDPQTKTEDTILLGTASCTNGCKYKYDDGVTGGLVNLLLTNSDNQVATTEQPWIIRSAIQLKKTGKFDWTEENFFEKIDYKLSSFFIVVKNPTVYSIFSTSDLVKDVPSTGSGQ